MGRLRFVVYIVCSWILLSFAVAQQKVEGIVFEDINRDGKFQQGEKPLRNMMVSNGDTIVITDVKGKFSLFSVGNKAVFPILPNTYTFNREGIISRSFFVTETSSSKNLSLDFGLIPTNTKEKFCVDIVGDVQVKDLKELDFAQRSILAELSQKGEKDFAVFMGDLSNDNDSILEIMRDCIDRLPFRSWCIAGNHDMNASAPRGSSLFQRLFGGDVYAFFYGKTCFIVLNNAETQSGTIPAAQIRFLRQLIKRLPPDILPILCQHIPLSETSNREEFLRAIGERRSLVLSAHTHTVSRHIWNKWVNEWVVGASCGSWWTGEYSTDGLPNALQQCGAPRNYFQLFVTKSDYQLKFKGVGLSSERQMDIWIKGQNTLDDSISAFSSFPKNFLVANVYAGGDSTIVRVSLDGKEWIDMQHTAMLAPSVSRVIEYNKKKFYPTAYANRLPFRNKKSPHLWAIQLPELERGFHSLKIRAVDKYGLLPIEMYHSFYVR